jgi:hypothetical protein
VSDSRHKSCARLMAKLAHYEAAGAMYQGEALYHAQIDWMCQLLDIVDELADPVTAALITDAIGERLTGDGASEAAKRQRDAKAQYERLMREPLPDRPRRAP